MKLIFKLAALFLLIAFTFMLGANQHRINGWPFDQGYFAWTPAFKGIRNSGDKDKKKEGLHGIEWIN